MREEEKLYESIGQSLAEAQPSQLFGKPCFKIGKKAFVCFFQRQMVFKLTGDAHRDALSLDGSRLFDPSGKGRPMKEWVQVPFDYADQWPSLAQAAMGYVSGSAR